MDETVKGNRQSERYSFLRLYFSYFENEILDFLNSRAPMRRGKQRREGWGGEGDLLSLPVHSAPCFSSRIHNRTFGIYLIGPSVES